MNNSVECPNCGDAVDFQAAPMTTLPEEAVREAYGAYVTFVEGSESGSVPVIDAVRAALNAALPFLPVQGAVNKLEDTALSESVNSFAASYEFRGDNGDYTPTDGERTMIEDAIQGFISDAGKVEGDGWLPIESAPKDGTPVLAYQAGRYFKCWLECDQYEGGYFWQDEEDSEPSPTHWRLLPTPPSNEVA